MTPTSLRSQIVVLDHPMTPRCHVLAVVVKETPKTITVRYYNLEDGGFSMNTARRGRGALHAVVQPHTPQETKMLATSLRDAFRRYLDDQSAASRDYESRIDSLCGQYRPAP